MSETGREAEPRVIPHGLLCSTLYSLNVKSSLRLLHRRRRTNAAETIRCRQMDLPLAWCANLVAFADGCDRAGKTGSCWRSSPHSSKQLHPSSDLSPMIRDMPCPEALRLKEEYRVALMRWSKTLFGPQGGLEADRMRLAAFDARNEATMRVAIHQQGCAICRQDKDRSAG
jgi:hypothetical protein